MYKVRFILLLALSLSIASCGNNATQPTVAASLKKSSTPTIQKLAPAASETQIPTEVFLPPTAHPTLAAGEWQDLPIVPVISDTIIEIYRHGLELGNDPNAFSKVGDCQTSTDFFLVDFDHEDRYNLGEYTHLQPTINHYQGSF